MDGLEKIRGALPASAVDIKLNLAAVLQPGALSTSQRWGVAIASAIASRNADLRDAVLAAARHELEDQAVRDATIDDATAAAVLMAMNNVYYRFRHFMAATKPGYSDKPARLRMNRLVRPLGSRADFELYSLAVSAINGCETCVRAHENVVTEGGITEDQVNDAIRIASTIYAAAVALEA